MASTSEYKEFVLDQLRELNDITCKSMMGEYLLYYQGILFGGIYDNRVLIKITNSNKKYSLNTAIPYDGAKQMYMIDNLDDAQYLQDVVKDTCKDLRK